MISLEARPPAAAQAYFDKLDEAEPL